jgi:hypothetical protein
LTRWTVYSHIKHLRLLAICNFLFRFSASRHSSSLYVGSARHKATTYTGQHEHRLNTDIYAASVIPTYDTSVLVGEDFSCLRPKRINRLSQIFKHNFLHFHSFIWPLTLIESAPLHSHCIMVSENMG